MEELWEKYQRQIIMASVMTTIAILIVTILMGATRPNNVKVNGEENSNNDNVVSEKRGDKKISSTLISGQKHTKMMVDVKGAVKTPGVYEFSKGMRVHDIIQLAGGITKSADSKLVNFAQQLRDQQIIYVPIKGESKLDTGQSTNSTVATKEGLKDDADVLEEQQVNINTATQQEIQKLNGIGEKKAEQILKYREEHGEFKKIEEIKNVKGIGAKMYEKIKEDIII
ncbi:helix-hairpin-helix domain-containing protein [Pediococcus claussenii]|uniref:Competence ComEA helix-hairpin-helix repeat region domain protein n=1 Tax=Pediococcus claussenii (strain ATCC BAA-344 / DSM 14800 / JCM 18046 / KCTC 3811 / LMG 21948 / P06) TaxID=701521 RepID=G8PCY1_PEDCP|nr:helix-hairpin-helix domain-containing protein [Pediococcus claussenii]AEV95116.1 competence ComEA helix-hairpin-helix repeat region domain protein [Pediococcus claussenii ATCC BAA-344]ANZ70302.1 hypothetical protein AYR57_08225 [Pediococcus claussenii]ANZ72118.1 hypothetical protein AYR58_08225 [Pediococcus claussenii]KRN18875.1 hypothetical protein IV79_GL000301 [Pediococcus claussenii]